MLKKVRFISLAVLGSLILIFSTAFSSPDHAQIESEETCDGQTATIVGTENDDTIMGTDGDDVIVGLGGNDTISGLDGNDVICAGGGNDTVYGEAKVRPADSVGGDDSIFGEGGNDLLIGDNETGDIPAGVNIIGGSDYIDGGMGADIIAGTALDTTITTTLIGIAFTADTLIGGDGEDTIYGQSRNFIFGITGPVIVESGNTTIHGGEGSDIIYGDNETMTIEGPGTAHITGWRDTITGGEGSDIIYGDLKNGNENITPIGDGANDIIDGGVGTDTGDAGPGFDICTNTEGVANCEQSD